MRNRIPVSLLLFLAAPSFGQQLEPTVTAAQVRVSVRAHPERIYPAPIAGIVSRLPSSVRAAPGTVPFGYSIAHIQLESLERRTVRNETCLANEASFMLPQTLSPDPCTINNQPIPSGTAVEVLSYYRGVSLVRTENGDFGFVDSIDLKEGAQPLLYGMADIDPDKWTSNYRWMSEAERYFRADRLERGERPDEFSSDPGEFDFRLNGQTWVNNLEQLTRGYFTNDNQQRLTYHLPGLSRHLVRFLTAAYGRIDSLDLQARQLVLEDEMRQIALQLKQAQYDLRYYSNTSCAPGTPNCPSETYRDLREREYSAAENAEDSASNATSASSRAKKWKARTLLLREEVRQKYERQEKTVADLEHALRVSRMRVAINEHQKDEGMLRFSQPVEILRHLVKEGEDVSSGQPLLIVSKPETFLVEWVVAEDDRYSRMFPEGKNVSVFLADPLELPGYLNLMRGGAEHRGIQRYYGIGKQKFHGTVRFRNTFRDEAGAAKIAIVVELYRPIVPGGWLVEMLEKPAATDPTWQQKPKHYPVKDDLVMLVSGKPLINPGDRMSVVIVPGYVRSPEQFNERGILWNAYFDRRDTQ